MNTVKGAVIVMSLAIAVLMTLMAYGLYQKSQNPDFKFFNLSGSRTTSSEIVPSAPVSGETPVQNTRVLEPFSHITLDVPQGATIVSATTSGKQLTVIIAQDGIRANQVWVIDLSSGKVLGRIGIEQ